MANKAYAMLLAFHGKIVRLEKKGSYTKEP